MRRAAAAARAVVQALEVTPHRERAVVLEVQAHFQPSKVSAAEVVRAQRTAAAMVTVVRLAQEVQVPLRFLLQAAAAVTHLQATQAAAAAAVLRAVLQATVPQEEATLAVQVELARRVLVVPQEARATVRLVLTAEYWTLAVVRLVLMQEVPLLSVRQVFQVQVRAAAQTQVLSVAMVPSVV